MVNIEEYLRQNKPETSDSTVSAYTVNLEKLHDRLHGTRSFEDLEWLKDSAAVLESLQKHCVSYLTQRNYLNAVVVILLNRDGFQAALHTYQAHRDKFNDQYMEIQQTKEPSAKQAQNWVPLSEIRELIDEYDEHAKLLRNHADINLKDKVAMQDRFMLHFWTTYPMRNDLHDTRVITKPSACSTRWIRWTRITTITSSSAKKWCSASATTRPARSMVSKRYPSRRSRYSRR